MQKEVPMPVIAGAVVVCFLFLGFLTWRFLVPQRVILEKGATLPPQPDFRTTAHQEPGATVLTPPDYRTGANVPATGR